MSYDLKYHTFLTAIERGEYSEVVRMISSGVFRVNEEILYYFEDRGRYIVTPLQWAVRHNHPKLCQYLLSHGAEPYRHQVQEYFPLHEACDKGFCEVVQKFIDAKCDLNYPTSEKDTPLHVACMRGNIACVHALLTAGADSNAKNVAGHTPLETALYNGHRDLEALFDVHNRIAVALPPCIVHKDKMSNGTFSEPDHQLLGASRKYAMGVKNVRTDPNQKLCPSTTSSSHLQSSTHLDPSTHLNPSSSHLQSTTHLNPPTPSTHLTPPSSSTHLNHNPSSSSIRHSKSFNQVVRVPVKHSRSFNHSNKQLRVAALEGWQRGRPSHNNCSLDSWQDLGDSLELCHEASGRPSERLQSFADSGQRVGSPSGGPSYHTNNAGVQRVSKHRRSLYESNSSPEFVVPVMESLEGRTRSYDQLVEQNQGLCPPPPPPPLPVSPARERIDQVSQAMWQSFKTIAGPMPKHPLVDTFHPLFLRLCPIVGFSEAQFLSVRDTSPYAPSHMCARQHCDTELGSPVEYQLLGTPLDSDPTVTFEGYCTLVFQASVVSDHRQDEESTLKLTLQVFTTGHDGPHHLSCLGKVLSSLPPHPNVAAAVHMFVGPCADVSVYLKRLRPPPMGPGTPCYVYAPTWKRAEHIFLHSYDLTLGRYFAEQKLKHPQPPYGMCEEEILVTLSQVLLGVAHLNRHHLLHCAISPECIHYLKRENLLVVGDLGGAISLCNLREESLRMALWDLSERGVLYVAPEVRCIVHERDGHFPPSYDLSLFVSKSDSFAVGRMMYELFRADSCLLDWEHMAESELPSLSYFSPQFNRILRGLVAYNPTKRTPASQGAFNCLALLFGPHTGRVQSAEDCHKWMFSESMELYMHPVLKGCVEDMVDTKSKLHYMYLAMADPEKVWEACQFLS